MAIVRHLFGSHREMPHGSCRTRVAWMPGERAPLLLQSG
jgi:hypothetical protein